MREKGSFGLFMAKLLRGLHPAQQTIYSWLHFRRDKKAECFPGLPEICKSCGINSRSTALHHLKELEKIGLVEKFKRQSKIGSHISNGYKVYEKRSDKAKK